MNLTVEFNNKEIGDFIEQRVNQFNTPFIGNTEKGEDFVIYLKDENEDIIAGITGYITRIKYVKANYAWVKESERDKGIGKKLFLKLEEFVKSQNGKVIQLCTLDFQAPDFYVKMGYSLAGILPKWMEGHDLLFYRKEL